MEITGRIFQILEARRGESAKGAWCSQEFLIETDEQYPKKVLFKIFGEEKINKAQLAVGKVVTVSFDINAREYNGRWYNDVNAWRVQSADTAQQAPEPAPAQEPAPEQEDDLPF